MLNRLNHVEAIVVGKLTVISHMTLMRITLVKMHKNTK